MNDNVSAAPGATRDIPSREQQSNHSPELPDIEVRRPRRGSLSTLWLIPLVAALLGGWLAYQSYISRGPTITISFADATGLEAGKTKLKYKNIEVGLVENIVITDDLSQVVATARMVKDAAAFLTEGAQFWVVRPRFSAAGISGLGTLVSGAYIAIDPAAGADAKAASRSFVGLEEPPPVAPDTPGLRFTLQAAELGSIAVGSPVYYRQIQVGKVERHRLAGNRQGIEIDVFVEHPHHKLVSKNSRFWNASGIDLELGADGIKFRTESLIALLEGGIAFETPDLSSTPKPLEDGARFVLYGDYASIGESQFTAKLPYLMHFDGSVRGLKPGAPVDFRGIQIGQVTDVRLEFSDEQNELRIPVLVEIEPERVAGVGHADPARFIDQLVERGLRAQLATGSLLTGQLFVEMELHPDAEPTTLADSGEYPELPTLPAAGLDAIESNINQLLTDIRKMPLNDLVTNLAGAAKGLDQLMNLPETAAIPGNVDATLGDIRQLADTVDGQIKPVAGNLNKTTKSLLTTLASVQKLLNPNSPFIYYLENMLEDGSTAASSIATLARYLERHPDSLVFGKSSQQ